MILQDCAKEYGIRQAIQEDTGGRWVVEVPSLNCAVCSGAIHLSAAASLIGHLVMRLHKDKLAAPLASRPGFALVSFWSELSFIAHGQGRSF